LDSVENRKGIMTTLTLRQKIFRSLAGLALLVILGLPVMSIQAQDSSTPEVVVLTIKGPITPIMAEYLERGLKIAVERQADVVVLQLDTPGGSIEVMNRMVQSIRGSRIPVVVYVAPHNAMAASAGTIITLAGHLAAMAPETTIGAASPVGGQGEDIGDTMESKVKEMLKASARTLAGRRGADAMRLAEQTIESARALTAEEALSSGLVDLQASDLEELLGKIDGRKVALDNKDVIVIRSKSAEIVQVPNSLIEQVLQMLVNPNLVFLLLSVGVQAILIELSSPGGWVAGFIGVVCLLMAIYGMGVLPVNWFGILFIILAFALFILEIKAPTHGALAAAGAASFITGALVLFNTAPRLPGFARVSVPLVVGTGIFIAASFLVMVTIALRAQHTPLCTGSQTLLGQIGEVRSQLSPNGTVQVAGELWGAEGAEGEGMLPEGTRIEVAALRGLTLIVRRPH
jgi:membrane-bound serine protease (ClpP class)